jgi:ribonuclease D
MHDEKATAVPFLDTKTALVEFVSACPRGVPCCIDTEADSLFSYREKLCLIQFAVADRLALIDPLTIDDLSPLLDYLDESSAVWIHGADYDLSILNRTYGRIPRVVYDTQIAARLLGWRTFGLAHLIENLFDVALSKQSQKKNWGERPLPERMLEYAANDVRYILSMAEGFSRELKALGRWEWFEQSCQAARDLVLTRPEKDRDELWRIPGWGKLEGRAMAYLREVTAAQEHCLHWGIPKMEGKAPAFP